MKMISILYGGRSTEHDASIKSYENIIENIDSNKFIVKYNIYIDRNGEIFCNSQKISFGEIIGILFEENIFTLNLLHGTEGEDGSWSGLADIRDLKGSFESVNTSSILMNKQQQCDIIKSRYNHILKVPYTILCNIKDDKEKIVEKLKCIKTDLVVVKPNNMGASHLTEKIEKNDIKSIQKLLDKIYEYDDNALIQEYIQAEEYTCGVIRKENKPFALEVINVHTGNMFLGHKEKHNKGLTEVLFVDNLLTNKIKEISIMLFQIFDVVGMCRFDFLVKNNEIYFLEGNLIPGFSKGSAFPRMLKESGITINHFLEELINSFENKREKKKYLKYNIED